MHGRGLDAKHVRAARARVGERLAASTVQLVQVVELGPNIHRDAGCSVASRSAASRAIELGVIVTEGLLGQAVNGGSIRGRSRTSAAR